MALLYLVAGLAKFHSLARVRYATLTLAAQGDNELAADRANYWKFVSRVSGKELRREGLDELVRAGSISADERDIMHAQQEKMAAALLEDERAMPT